MAVAAVSAVLGTCDRIVAEPYPDGDPCDDDSFRLAVNVLRLLKYECYLGVVQDALAGAYYVEALTRQIVARCWEAFLEIEDAGGIQSTAHSSSLGSILEKHTRPPASDG
jgi:methylmalonyl-CoA mutase